MRASSNVYRAELRSMIEYGPKAQPFNPGAPIAWTGVPGDLCQACASRLIGRGFGNELRAFHPLYLDTMPELPRRCLACSEYPRTSPA